MDMTEQAQVTALRERLAGRTIDLLFVNAAITRGDIPIGDVPTDMFVDVMVTNALSPMRVVESLQSLVTPDGTIGIMSSSQGSVSLNTNGGHEVYRASKSALNQLMRSYAARHAEDRRTLLLINPGWVRTELGGPHALLSIDESIPGVADTIERHSGEPGLQFLDYRGQVVPW
jgi:NAD(P)-dependent dehydrogenase (short-subunit alcohol dehydrogenase family)